ncbi:PD40 domain-containing protein [Roseateles puraquae]|uniref:PEP-CTERM sorting domain-containing protein n=1 Tax=Roseateles puraquae TaxID=431059 RepID=A0A254NAQ9_9BURK|nr:PD40 domain-containing protein [Roseateles puraquae]MDG0853983.1 hypothetical protein [Roseateles puraquae]OWR04810.1 hypothetical protein CDO81_09565 [Roseateles puraquae]
MSRNLTSLLPALALFGAAAGVHAAPLQITNDGSYYQSYGPVLSADGNRLAYYSATNPTGGNSDRNMEVFVYDRPSAQLRQITDMPGGSLAGGNQTPSLSGDGSRVAFQRYVISGNYAYFQTQTYDLNTNTLATLTPLGYSESSAISRDGKTIAVSIGNVGLKLYDTTTQTFSGVVMPAPLSFRMSGDGKRIVYEAFAQGVVLYDLATGTSKTISPPGSGYNQYPEISADGNSIVFNARYNPLGQNADGSSEVFRYDIASGQLLQITHGNGRDSMDASLSRDGTRIVFSSADDLTGHNADGNYELFVYDLIAGSFQQMTDTLGLTYSAAGTISDDGNTIAYMSTMNLDGRNPYGNYQIFMDTLAPRVTTTDLPEPGTLALTVLALPLLGAVRRRGR